MTKQEIEDITYKYFNDGLEEYEDLEDLRHQNNTVIIRGTTYEGSTEKAIMKKLNDFRAIDERRDFDEVKQIVDNEIIPRCGIEPTLIKDLKKKKSFYWKMFKYEIELLGTDLSRYNDYSAKKRIDEQNKLYPVSEVSNSNDVNNTNDDEFEDVVVEKKDVPGFDELILEVSNHLRDRRGISESYNATKSQDKFI